SERARLPALADALADRLVALLDSPRPDRGVALLLGMARLAPPQRTRAAGRGIPLDAFPPHPPPLAPPGGARPHGGVRLPAADRWRTLASARAGLVAADEGATPESVLAAVESAGNRALELTGALEAERPLRTHAGALVPVGRRMDLPSAETATPALDAALAEA